MRVLTNKNCSKISGAGKWSSENSDWGSLPYSPISSAPPTGSQIDYGLMAILMGNAALFGCLSGLGVGGIYGCATKGAIAGVGTMYAMIAADSYNMWKDNKK